MTTYEALKARIEPYWAARPVWRGLDIDSGWVPLVDQLITDLEATGNVPEIVQIKSKFGGLRFYVSGSTPEQREIISDAEARSEQICELCGADGSLVFINHWYWTLCVACKDMKESERAAAVGS